VAGQACLNERGTPTGMRGPLTSTGQGGNGTGFNTGVDDPCEIEGDCGTHVHEVLLDVPNVYFILDRSGSMNMLVNPNSTAYDVVRDAAIDMVTELGALINVGAALFPSPEDADPCVAGAEQMPVTAGDPPGNYSGGEGPTTTKFRQATKTDPVGGTPISATLEALVPTLAELPGRTIVMVLTDGGPNCNDQATCEPEECLAYLAGECAPGVNCCAPDDPDYGPQSCLDRSETVSAVESIHDEDIDVYVVGVAGSEYFADVLNEMAEAGGTAQDGSFKYYRVEDFDELGGVFALIAGDAINCQINLADPPSEEDMTNVYADCEVIEQSQYTGWIWSDSDTIELTGAWCDKLKAGKIGQVRIVTGCPTELPK